MPDAPPIDPSGSTPHLDVVEVRVEPWPAGGWAVRLEGHPIRISRHDTEDEALARAEAYRRGLEREANVNAQGEATKQA